MPPANAGAPRLISVVMPIYNAARFLSRTLPAVLRQSYPPAQTEIILIDDGSVDDSADVAERIAQDHGRMIRVLRQRNGGPASARNAGIRAAHGEYVAFLDADCEPEPTWLASLVALLEATGADGVGGPIAAPPPRTTLARYLIAAGFYRHRARGGQVDYLITGNAAFTRESLLAVGGFVDRPHTWGEDADLSFRLKLEGCQLLLSPTGSVVHHGEAPTLRAFTQELFRYGYGSGILSPRWHNGRSPLREAFRHLVAALCAPALAVRYASGMGAAMVVRFTPLIVIEHTAFSSGVLAAWFGGGRKRGTSLR